MLGRGETKDKAQFPEELDDTRMTLSNRSPTFEQTHLYEIVLGRTEIGC